MGVEEQADRGAVWRNGAADTAVGRDGNYAKIAMLQTPDGNGRLEFFECIHRDAIQTDLPPNEIGMRRVTFSPDDIEQALAIAAAHGCHPLRDLATCDDAARSRSTSGRCARRG